MAVLTRLDRLAEQAGERDALLRNVSEDMEDYLELVEADGDTDAFVDARRPAPPPEAEPAPEPEPAAPPNPAPRVEDDYDRVAALMGCLDYKAEHSFDIDISDLEGLSEEELSPDQMLRAHYSGYYFRLVAGEAHRAAGKTRKARDGSPSAYTAKIEAGAARAAAKEDVAARAATVDGAADATPEPETGEAQPSTSST